MLNRQPHLIHFTQVIFHIPPWRVTHNIFKNPVKIGDAGKAAFIGNHRNAFVFINGEFFAGLVNAHAVKEADKSLPGMFFKIAAKGLGCHAGFPGHIVKRNGFVAMLQNVIVDIADTDTLTLCNRCRNV